LLEEWAEWVEKQQDAGVLEYWGVQLEGEPAKAKEMEK
jgi:hypothetical protein